MNEPTIKRIPLSNIHVDDKFNCRGRIASIDVADLAKDIKVRGLIQPVSVVPIPEDSESDAEYMLIAGFRRFMAHRVNKSEDILGVIIETPMDEAERRLFNLAENVQRQDLNILQEAYALKRLKEIGLSEVDVADRLQKSRGWVQVRYMVLDLPEELHIDLLAGNITQSQIRSLYSIYRATGKKDPVFEAAKQMKNDKIKGVKDRDYAPKSAKTKKIRGKREMYDMVDMLYDCFGKSPHHRAMAITLGWACGNVTDGEFYAELGRQAKEYNIFWNIPEDFKQGEDD